VAVVVVVFVVAVAVAVAVAVWVAVDVDVAVAVMVFLLTEPRNRKWDAVRLLESFVSFAHKTELWICNLPLNIKLWHVLTERELF
jgi:hypothetical protein